MQNLDAVHNVTVLGVQVPVCDVAQDIDDN